MRLVWMDGILYRVAVDFDTLDRTFEIPAGINAGEMLDHSIERDPKGTFISHSMTVQPDPRYPLDYDAFYEAISDPGAIHLVEVPYGQGSIYQEVLVTGGTDLFRGKMAGVQRWKNLKINFEGRAPYRRP